MKGRKPKLELVDGGASLDRCPGPPEWLRDAAKVEWRRVAPILRERGHLTPEATATLEAYCVAVGCVREAYQPKAPSQSALFGDPPPIGSADPKQMRLMFAAMREARLLAAELGLTPQRRGSGGNGKDNPDGWDSDILA